MSRPGEEHEMWLKAVKRELQERSHTRGTVELNVLPKALEMFCVSHIVSC